MGAFIIYALQVTVSIVLFFGLYILFLRNETFFRLRRGYFLLALIFSLSYPLIEFEIEREILNNVPITAYLLPEIEISANGQQAQMITETSGIFANPLHILLLVWFVGAIVLLSRFLIQLGSLFYHLIDKEWEKLGNYRLAYLEDSSFSSCSFFGWIIINTAGQTDRQIQDIIWHESVHVSQFHSIDVLLYELFCILFWWNPAAWLMKNEMKLNLEYLADEGVIGKNSDLKEYQYTLLQVNVANTGIAFINNFNVSHLKKRISMMNKKRSSILKSIKFLVAVPLAIALSIGNVAYAVQKDGKREAGAVTSSLETMAPSPQQKTQKIYDYVEEQPKFPGGEAAMMKYLQENLIYPVKAQQAGAQGRILIRFVVGADGLLSDFTALNKESVTMPDEVVVVGYGASGEETITKEEAAQLLEEEAIRTIKSMPKWTPGKQKGKAVPVYYVLPVLFRLF